MFAFRVDKKKHITSLVEGIPGEKSDFRWNTKGHPIIYASSTRSLALHEKTGNMSKPFYGLSPSFVLVAIEIPDSNYQKIMPEELPDGWDDIGSYHKKTQEIGDNFIASDELALFVPSIVVKGEFDVLINPRKVKDFTITTRVEGITERLKGLR